MELLLVFLPLLGSLTVLLFGRQLGGSVAVALTTSFVGLSLILALSVFVSVGLGHTVAFIPVSTWISSGDLRIGWSFLFDPLTSVMLLVVLSISFFVHLYSIDYMAEDPHKIRFFSYLSLFTFFMLLLVSAANFLQLFVGWEGVGVCSYLLINFWFTRKQANKSALKAMVVNRIGDFGLLIGMFLVYSVFKTLDFSTIFLLTPSVGTQLIEFLGIEFHLLTLVSLFIFVGAVGKSAQLGLHTWLPDAMEGPTPVSALIHAATMVTAGVFLLIRCSPLLEHSPAALSTISVVGALTALFGATVGLFQNDLKRVIAYSTCSQLGYMVFCCGNSAYNVAMFHLYNHAFFKALLFLGAGAVIHAYSDEQDMRRMGGLVNLLPFTYSIMLVGSLSLMGLPFLTGFYSKDLILEVSASTYSTGGVFSYWLGVVSAFFTSFYSIRLLYLSFLSLPRGFFATYRGSHEAPRFMLLSLFPLSVASIFVGYLSRELFVSFGTDFWNFSIFNLPSNLGVVQSEFLPTSIKLLPVFFSLVGGGLSLLLHFLFFASAFVSVPLLPSFRPFYLFLNKRWFFDKLSNEIFTRGGFLLGYKITFKLLDRGVIELIGPTGLIRLIGSTSDRYTKVHSGYIYHYLFLMVAGVALLLAVVWFHYWFLLIKVGLILLTTLILSLFFELSDSSLAEEDL